MPKKLVVTIVAAIKSLIAITTKSGTVLTVVLISIKIANEFITLGHNI